MVKTFKQATIRTRLIVKLGNSSLLSYKVKLVGEIAEAPNASVKNNEQLKEWDRVLRKYKPKIVNRNFKLHFKTSVSKAFK
ncbi:MAG: hypothetical protein K1X82_03965 [Bacteroidia bacterium]|nr:hypothetical protein [Bacteroidia bacterium]